MNAPAEIRLQMDPMNHNGHDQASAPHAGHKMSDVHASHDRHAGHSVAMFRDKLWLSLAFTIPVVFWSTDVQHWLGYTAPSLPGPGRIHASFCPFGFVYRVLAVVPRNRRASAVAHSRILC